MHETKRIIATIKSSTNYKGVTINHHFSYFCTQIPKQINFMFQSSGRLKALVYKCIKLACWTIISSFFLLYLVCISGLYTIIACLMIALRFVASNIIAYFTIQVIHQFFNGLKFCRFSIYHDGIVQNIVKNKTCIFFQTR